MFILNIDELGIPSDHIYVCNEAVSNILLKNGFCLLSANFAEDKFFYIKSTELIDFLQEGGE